MLKYIWRHLWTILHTSLLIWISIKKNVSYLGWGAVCCWVCGENEYCSSVVKKSLQNSQNSVFILSLSLVRKLFRVLFGAKSSWTCRSFEIGLKMWRIQIEWSTSKYFASFGLVLQLEFYIFFCFSWSSDTCKSIPNEHLYVYYTVLL